MPLYRASATRSPGQLLKEKKCSGERTKIYCTMHFGSFDLTLKFKPPARTHVEFDQGWNEGKAKDGLALVSCSNSNLHASTFHPVSAAPSPPLTDTRTQVQLLPKERILATDETRWGRQIVTTSVSCPFPSSDTREQPVASGRKVDLEQSRKQTAEGWGWCSSACLP